MKKTEEKFLKANLLFKDKTNMTMIDKGLLYINTYNDSFKSRVYPLSTFEFFELFDSSLNIQILDFSQQCFHSDSSKDKWILDTDFDKNTSISRFKNKLDTYSKGYQETFILRFKFIFPDTKIRCSFNDDSVLDIDCDVLDELIIRRIFDKFYPHTNLVEIFQLAKTNFGKYVRFDEKGKILGLFDSLN